MTPSSSDFPAGRVIDGHLIARDVVARMEPAASFPMQIRTGLMPAICESMAEPYSVTLLGKTWDQKHLYGMLIRYENHAEVSYSMGLNTCWRRFVVCKELAHLLIDSDREHFTSDPVALVHQLITDVPFTEAGSELFSEQLAMIIAIEMMIPWNMRDQLRAMAIAGQSDLQIAQFCRVPQKLITLVLRSQYAELSRTANEALSPRPGPLDEDS